MSEATNLPTIVKVFPVWQDARIPTLATSQSACFDIYACLTPGLVVSGFTSENVPITQTVGENGSFKSDPGVRWMIPTGIILDIPLGYSVRVHSRSGLAIKQGVVLVNGEGIIDADYIDPLYVLLHNLSSVPVEIGHHTRIAQMELVPVVPNYSLYETKSKPESKTTRDGGFGSTGK